MAKSKWARALIGVLAVVALPIGAARADNKCEDCESGISDREKRVAESEALPEQTPIPPVYIIACNDSSVDLRSVAVGFKCLTSQASIYERVARNNFSEAWMGPDKLIWSDFVGKYTQYAAMETCRNLGGALPSRADFERGNASGFREVLPNRKDRWFWSSSVHPKEFDIAYVFHGSYGFFDIVYRDTPLHSVRCVGR